MMMMGGGGGGASIVPASFSLRRGPSTLWWHGECRVKIVVFFEVVVVMIPRCSYRYYTCIL